MTIHKEEIQVRGAIDRCIQELTSVGLEYEEALGLLIRQCTYRIDSTAMVRKIVLDILSDRIDVDDDDCGVTKTFRHRDK
jgi:hypothetical protein